MINAAEVFYRNPEDITDTGRMIRQVRKQMGLSQMELGMRMDMPGNAVSRYEQGNREMGMTTFFQFAEALGCGIETISPKRVRQYNLFSERTKKFACIFEKLPELDQDLLIQIAERMAEKS